MVGPAILYRVMLPEIFFETIAFVCIALLCVSYDFVYRKTRIYIPLGVKDNPETSNQKF